MEKGKGIFKARYEEIQESSTIHWKPLLNSEARFFISKVLKNASIWDEFDADIHCSAALVKWQRANVNVLQRKVISEQGTEANYPEPLSEKKRKVNPSRWQKNKESWLSKRAGIYIIRKENQKSAP